MILTNLIGLSGFLFIFIAMIVLVPIKQIAELALFGSMFGLGVAMLLVYAMQAIYGFWEFINVDFFYLLDIPIFLSAAWTPGVIIFAHLVSKQTTYLKVMAIIVLFAGGATVAHYFLLNNNMLRYQDWSLILTFSLAVVIHLGILAYLYIVKRFQGFEELRSK